MPWKPEYEANREARMAADPQYRERVIEQRKRGVRTPEENRQYMREYYRANKDRWNKRTPEQRAQINESRRQRYADDPEYRQRILDDARKSDPIRKRDNRIRRQFGIGAA